MESYKANQKCMYYHIQECIKKSKTRRIDYLLQHMELSDLVNDCWTTAMTSDKPWAMEVRSWYNNQKIDSEILDRRTRQRVKVTVRNFVDKEYYKQMRREKAMRESVLENVSPYNVKSPSDIFDKIDFSKEEMFLIWWKMGMIDDDQVCCFLNCCFKTVYNRWAKLKRRIVKEYNHEKV
jgi:hypothetical protein